MNVNMYGRMYGGWVCGCMYVCSCKQSRARVRVEAFWHVRMGVCMVVWSCVWQSATLRSLMFPCLRAFTCVGLPVCMFVHGVLAL